MEKGKETQTFCVAAKKTRIPGELLAQIEEQINTKASARKYPEKTIAWMCGKILRGSGAAGKPKKTEG